MTHHNTVGVAEWLRISAEHHPDRACLVTDEGTFTFAETESRVNRLANALGKRGIGRGTRVAIFATDSFRYVETLFASLRIAATYVPLNFRLAEPELRLLLQTAAPECLFISERYAANVAAVLDDVPSVRFVVTYDGQADPGTSVEQFEELLRNSDECDGSAEFTDDDIVGLCFTSGTTGLPKGVVHSHRTIKHYVMQAILERRLFAESFHYSPAPIYHVAGMLFPMATIARGGTSLVLGEFDPDAVLTWMQSGRLTDCFLVPTMLSTLLAHERIDAGNFDSLRSIAYGGAPMSPALLRRSMDVFDCDFINMFGAGTEAGLQTLLSPEDHRRALDGHEHLLGSVGKPALGIDLRLVDDDMNDVPDGEVGEIATRSDGTMVGYLDQPDLTAEVLIDGWIRCGDLAWRDPEGYLYLSGRRNDMIIRGGENIYPIEIESVIADLPGVVEVAVIGAPDDHWGEIVHAFVVMSDDTDFDLNHATAVCGERLATYKVPAVFEVLPGLPRNASGKILKRELRNALHQR